MNVIETPLKGLFIIEPRVFEDDRGYFYESYNKDTFAKIGIKEEFVQDNHSYSQKNTVRGLHFQKEPFAQSKLVRVVQGEVFDVAVDIRPDSPTFGQWFGVTLSAENKKMFYVPTGFAHGFCVTSETAHFTYKCGNRYDKASESGIIWNDPDVNIQWPIDPASAILSEKDLQLTTLQELELK